jgi:hypothetical protein
MKLMLDATSRNGYALRNKAHACTGTREGYRQVSDKAR